MRLRERRSRGVVLVAPVEVGEGGVALLVSSALLKEHQTRDRKAVGEACRAALEQWAVGRGPGCTGRGALSRHSGPGTKGHWAKDCGSGARAEVSVANCGSTVVASSNRLRRFLRSGLGLGFPQMVCSPSVSVRLSRHTDRGNRVRA